MMQQQDEFAIICPEHGETTLSNLLKTCEFDQICCFSCKNTRWNGRNYIELNPEYVAEAMRDVQVRRVKELEIQCEQRSGKLQELFIDIRNQFNKTIEDILNIIKEQSQLINIKLIQEIETLNQQIKLPSFNDVIDFLQNQYQVKLELFDKYNSDMAQIRDKILEEYFNLQLTQNQIIKTECFQRKFKDQKISQNPKIKEQSDSYKIEFEQIIKQQTKCGCNAITMDKDERILLIGTGDLIQMWDFNLNEEKITLKSTLHGHTTPICCLQQKRKLVYIRR